ncbi:MMPL family transporter [Acidiferrimicrobium sp. IK]|nr:MMPL family transporter [Acidiferrimicrobium sp. IK]MCU4182804.1 MMPL family transporter [Acidiferrimicrobium sp. IK]
MSGSHSPSTRTNLAASSAGWSARHRRWAILGWLAFVVGAYLLGGVVGQRSLTDVQMGNGSSATAARVYEQAFPYHSTEQVLVQGRGAVRIGDPVYEQAIAALIARLQRVPTVGAIQSPLTAAGAGLRSADDRSMLVTFQVAGDSNQAVTNVQGALAATAATASAYPQLRIEEFGAASANKALLKAFDGDFTRAEHTSLPITLLVLLVAFGAVVAAGVPLLLGLTAVLGALGLIGPVSHLVPMAQGTIRPVVLLIGLAVGVDYSMFYLRRKLEERHAGLDSASALARAAATSGRAVLVSGLTVMTAMAGMLLAGNAVFTSLAVGTMLVVAVAIIGSVTVLPAVMSKLGDGVERGGVPVIARRRREGQSRLWRAVVGRVLSRPVWSAALSCGLLLVIAVPALGMRTVDPGTVGLPRNLPIMATFDRIQAAFPGAPTSAVVVVKARDVTGADVQAGISAMTKAALASGQMAGPIVEVVSPDRTVAAVTISLAGSGTDRPSTAALATLRGQVLPSTIGAAPGAKAYVMGTTAASVDFNQVMKSHLVLVFAFVLGLAFVLLLVTFRSLVIPLLTIALNVLSVGAAYGVTVFIFQDGHLRSLLDAQDVGGVIDWLPLFLFVVLFGLSMDYHVLILSRIREGHDRGLPTRDAVSAGVTSTAGVITSAAVVMVAVFSVFATLNEIIFKQLGVALAAAVLIDATVVRLVLLPSSMALLGRWNWYLPRWMGRPPPPRPYCLHGAPRSKPADLRVRQLRGGAPRGPRRPGRRQRRPRHQLRRRPLH